MSGLNSCYVWIKTTGSGSLAAPTRSVTLNCVPCQLQTHRTAKEVTGSTPLSPSLSFSTHFHHCFCRTFHFNATYMQSSTVKEKTAWCTESGSESDGGTFFERSNKTWGLSCQIILTTCVRISAMSSWNRVADVLSLPSSSGQICQDLIVKGTKDRTDGKSRCLNFSFFTDRNANCNNIGKKVSSKLELKFKLKQ